MTITRLCKRAALFLSVVAVSPLMLAARLGIGIGRPGLFHAFATGLSLMPGKTGSYLRAAYYLGTLKRMSPDVIIGFGSFFSNPGAEVGNWVSIGAYTIIGRAILGDRVMIASRVSITSGKHQHGSAAETLDVTEGPVFKTVRVGDDTWIGEGATVMADVGANCIVAAGSVVTRDMPAALIVGGNPARAVSRRG